MRKFLKNQKGFTLIELMMVIAVIGILAAVLVPKIGTIKDDAKSAGVETNMNTIQAMAESMMTNYKKKTADVFEADLAAKIGTKLTNPISDSSLAPATTTDAFTAIPATDVGATITTAAWYSTGDEAAALDETGDWTLTDKTKVKGTVFIGAVEASGKLSKVYLTGFDAVGNAMRTVEITP